MNYKQFKEDLFKDIKVLIAYLKESGIGVRAKGTRTKTIKIKHSNRLE